jgi:RNA polymerase sigma-70 factor (sigma-E family)
MSRHDFDRFVADNANGLLRTAYLIVGDLHEAEDLVQETLLKVARRWARVSRMDHPAAYARRSRHRSELSEAHHGEPAAPAALDPHDELHVALAALPPRQRAVLVLRYFLDLPESEVAAALQCSLGTVKSTASRGLARLGQTLRPTSDKRSVAS